MLLRFGIDDASSHNDSFSLATDAKAYNIIVQNFVAKLNIILYKERNNPIAKSFVVVAVVLFVCTNNTFNVY